MSVDGRFSNPSIDFQFSTYLTPQKIVLGLLETFAGLNIMSCITFTSLDAASYIVIVALKSQFNPLTQ